MLPNTTRQPSVFISYARADDDPDYDDPEKSFLRRLYNALIDAGFKVWWDRVSLPARGLAFGKEIEDAIRAHDRLLLVIGPGAVESKYVEAEWRFALEQCKAITPILRIGDGYEIVPADLTAINTIDCRASRNEAAALADIIARLSEDAPLGNLTGVRPLPKGLIRREGPFAEAHAALIANAIKPTVISAPPSTTAVYGVGGVGKSTLAAALAHDCTIRRSFPDGVIWVEIGQTPDVVTRMADIGAAFGDSRDHYIGPAIDEQSAAAHLGGVLRDKHALIVLDDVWDSRVLGRFPVAGTACRVLVTTRSSGLAKKVDGADIALAMLTPDEGGRLLVARAGGDPEDPIYLKITEFLGGHTLAVRLSADQLANGYADDPADLLRLLTKRENPFKTLTLIDDDKNENLELSLSLSYAALKPEMQARFRATGVLALEGTFDRVMLAALWGDEDEDDARAPLTTLLDNGLLEDAGDRRFTQHRLLRAYARALLDQTVETNTVFARYAAFVTTHSEQFNALPPEHWRQLDPLLPHVSAVGEHLFTHWSMTETPAAELIETTENFAYSITRYVALRPQMTVTINGHERLGLRWLEMGLAASQQTGNQRRESLFHNELAILWSAIGEKRKALQYYEQALPLKRAISDWSGEATTLNNIGRVWEDMGDIYKALEYYDQALLLSRSIGNKLNEASVLNNIGMAWDVLGVQQKALDYYEQSLSMMRLMGNPAGEAVTLNNIGMVWRKLGDNWKALDYYEQAVLLRRKVGDRAGEATTLNNIGGVWSELGDKRKALEYYAQALPLRRAVGDRAGEADTCFNIGAAYHSLGDLDLAITYIERCIYLEIEVEHPKLENDRQVLQTLKRQRDGIEESLEHDNMQVMTILKKVYEEQGANAVWVMLKESEIDESIIEQVIAALIDF